MGARRAALSAKEARRLAIEAQGLHRPRPGAKPTGAQLGDVVEALGAVQLDAINVLERTQFVVLFSRVGAYDRQRLHDLAGPTGKRIWEYWGHAASLLPVSIHPLLRWRMDHGSTYVAGPKVRARMDAWYAANRTYIEAVLHEVREHGPLSGAQLSDPRRRDGEWWGRRSVGRQALEWLFGTGELAAWRAPSFERIYDVPERVIPSDVLAQPTPSVDDAQRQLVLRSARALGVATAGDLAGYFMLQPRVAKARIAELVEDGALVAVDVEGWSEAAYVLADADAGGGRRSTRRRPTREDRATLLSPFDSLIWDRKRTSRLFGFDFTIEVYVPAPKRVYGYYVLPLLYGEDLVGRLDLKADRKASALCVQGAFAEPGVVGSAIDSVASGAASELHELRAWLGLDTVAVARRGDLAGPLASALATSAVP